MLRSPASEMTKRGWSVRRHTEQLSIAVALAPADSLATVALGRVAEIRTFETECGGTFAGCFSCLQHTLPPLVSPRWDALSVQPSNSQLRLFHILGHLS